MRASEFLTELLDPNSSYPLYWYDTFAPKERSARAYDEKKGFLDIKFIPLASDIVEIEFSRNDSYDVTGGGSANKVFATMLEAIREYLKGYKPKIIVFGSKGKSRTKLYQSLINRYAQSLGYKQFDINKLSPETQEKLAFSGSDLMVLRKIYDQNDVAEGKKKKKRKKVRRYVYGPIAYGWYGYGSGDGGEGGGDGGGMEESYIPEYSRDDGNDRPDESKIVQAVRHLLARGDTIKTHVWASRGIVIGTRPGIIDIKNDRTGNHNYIEMGDDSRDHTYQLRMIKPNVWLLRPTKDEYVK
jgi:hypothetical protein